MPKEESIDIRLTSDPLCMGQSASKWNVQDTDEDNLKETRNCPQTKYVIEHVKKEKYSKFPCLKSLLKKRDHCSLEEIIEDQVTKGEPNKRRCLPLPDKIPLIVKHHPFAVSDS